MNNNLNKQTLVKLHNEISFRHSFIIHTIFKKHIEGILGIDYFSLFIIDSTNTLSCYSSKPALEYNLFHSELWFQDGIFKLINHQSGSFVFWDELYPNDAAQALRQTKQQVFGFKFGFFIMKKIDKLFLIYSFATQSNIEKSYYLKSKLALSKIGDYFVQELEPIYKLYVQDLMKPKLILVVDNTK